MKSNQDHIIQEVVSSIYDKLFLKSQNKRKIDFFDPDCCNVNRVIKEAVKNNKKAIVITFEKEADLKVLKNGLFQEKNFKSLCQSFPAIIMKTSFVNPKEAFEQAIEKGILSAREEEQDFAGNFMYMYSLEGVYYFKNRITRKYGHNRDTIIQSLSDKQ